MTLPPRFLPSESADHMLPTTNEHLAQHKLHDNSRAHHSAVWSAARLRRRRTFTAPDRICKRRCFLCLVICVICDLLHFLGEAGRVCQLTGTVWSSGHRLEATSRSAAQRGSSGLASILSMAWPLRIAASVTCVNGEATLRGGRGIPFKGAQEAHVRSIRAHHHNDSCTMSLTIPPFAEIHRTISTGEDADAISAVLRELTLVAGFIGIRLGSKSIRLQRKSVSSHDRSQKGILF